MPKNEEGNSKGIAFIQFKSKEAVEKALAFDGDDYGGRTINVQKAGDRGDSKGKGEKGDKGKGKGKDGDKGKGKGKGKKGKGKGMSDAKMAARDGAMVESTGKKQTFADSDDDDDAPPKKKAKKAPPPESDDDDDE